MTVKLVPGDTVKRQVFGYWEGVDIAAVLGAGCVKASLHQHQGRVYDHIRLFYDGRQCKPYAGSHLLVGARLFSCHQVSSVALVVYCSMLGSMVMG